ncbi:hypothetical protein IW261DRAFT_1595948 [Armillaria novae-zelandiae]|uniref:Uncharacterized protein n=1 Tax=Armillaria novae-zelandiae TaxID=153914 RepID=A0AA39NZK2_9AGAR|nr:hypothetical protein IW261DRAFT_1595948 [Armillaria novae-zelandiae]
MSINPTLVSSGYYTGKNGLWKPQTRQSPVSRATTVQVFFVTLSIVMSINLSALRPNSPGISVTVHTHRSLVERHCRIELLPWYHDQVWICSMTIPRIRDDEATVIVQRTTIVVAYCLILIFTFWLITLMITLLTITTVVFRFRQKNEIVVVPIGTVFAGIQLRSSVPGVPEGFGTSFLVLHKASTQICTIFWDWYHASISAIAMISIYIFIDPDDPSRRALTWSELARKFRRALEIPVVDIARQTRVESPKAEKAYGRIARPLPRGPDSSQNGREEFLGVAWAAMGDQAHEQDSEGFERLQSGTGKADGRRERRVKPQLERDLGTAPIQTMTQDSRALPIRTTSILPASRRGL